MKLSQRERHELAKKARSELRDHFFKNETGLVDWYQEYLCELIYGIVMKVSEERKK